MSNINEIKLKIRKLQLEIEQLEQELEQLSTTEQRNFSFSLERLGECTEKLNNTIARIQTSGTDDREIERRGRS